MKTTYTILKRFAVTLALLTICTSYGIGQTLTIDVVKTDETCPDACDGIAIVTITGASTPPYEYHWFDQSSNEIRTVLLSNSTTDTITGLCDDPFTVLVRDASNNFGTKNFEISGNSAFVLTFLTKIQPSCADTCDGSLFPIITGGQTPYTSYVWNDGYIGLNRTGLCAGTYILRVTDANGCKANFPFVMIEPNPIVINFTEGTLDCSGDCDGTILASVTGGTTPYDYDWSGSPNGDGTNAITDLCAGSYSLSIEDAKNCPNSKTTSLSEPDPIAVDTIITHVNCNGNSTGSIALIPNGGIPPFTYIWSPNVSTTANSGPIPAGTYNVTVTDNNGAGVCPVSLSVVVTQPDPLDAGVSAIDVDCFGNSTGTVVATPTGGTAPFTYNWNIPSTDSLVGSRPIGTYTVTVTDTNGCTNIASIDVEQPDLLVAGASATNITCNTFNDGTATAAPSGGSPNYQYLWSNSSTNQTIGSLSQGSYTVTVTDNNGCAKIQTVNVTEPSAFSINLTKTNVTCNGAANGTAMVAPLGGTPPFSYVWKKGVIVINTTTPSISAQSPAANYSIKVTDNQGCPVTQNFAITQPNPVVPNVVFNNLKCYGDCNAQAEAFPTGGNPGGYSYLWSASAGGATTSAVSNLCANLYAVTVTDNSIHACQGSGVFTINQPDSINPGFSSIDASCGNCDGSAGAAVSGGVGPYTYQWENGDTLNFTTLLCTGYQNITITDDSACVRIDSVEIGTPASVNPNPTQTNPNCADDLTGIATVSPTGGVPGYLYNWSTGATTPSISGLGIGSYTVTITDAQPCETTYTFNITTATVLNINGNPDESSCANICNGEASVTVSGGVAPYSYLWDAGAGNATTPNVDSLCIGSYNITVTDDSGCVETAIITINPTITIVSGITVVTEDCNDAFCDGNASATATGGVGPYSFAWSSGFITQSNDSTSLADSLCGGQVITIAQDQSGCTGSDTIIMPVAAAVLQVQDSIIEIGCNNQVNGEYYAIVSGGAPPYTYLWNTASTSSFITGLAAGFYSVTVLDSNNCQVNTSNTLINPDVLVATADITDVECNGDGNGTATIIVTGGTAPYSYLWDAGAGNSTNPTVGSLIPGTYTCTITDDHGCTDTAVAIIEQPAALTLSTSFTPVLCFGGNSGTATGLPLGGTAPYSYQWDLAALFQTTQTATSLEQGMYSVTVTDTNGCTANASATITQPNQLDGFFTKNDLLCYGDFNGTATIHASGGISPYIYLWNDPLGQTDSTATGLPAGTFSVTVTDQNGCDSSGSITLNQPDSLDLVMSTSEVQCNGNSDGDATVTASGGTPNYTYLWDANANGQTTPTANFLDAGFYTVTVTDNNGCKKNNTIEIVQPQPLIGSPSSTASNCTIPDGTAKVNPLVGGTSPYTHSWSNGSSNPIITGLAGGFIYTDTIRDDNGCTLIISVPVSELGGPTAATIISSNVSCYADCDGVAAVTAVFGGYAPYTYQWTDPGSTTDSVVSGLCADTLFLAITDDSSCTFFAPPILIGQPDSMDLDLTAINTSCNGIQNGAVIANPTGGATPYAYNWSNGSSNPGINNLATGTYTLSLTDNNGCMQNASVVISENTPINISKDSTNVSCYEGSNGIATVSPSGGNSPYTYLWDANTGFQTDSFADNLPAGQYTVTISDNMGCAVIEGITISQPNPLSAVTSSINSSCGNSTGSAVVTPSGGTVPYSYLWLGTGITDSINPGLAAGLHTVILNDNEGCTDTLTVGVSDTDGPSISETHSNVSCFGGINGSIAIVASGGIAPYNYLWAPSGETGTSISNKTAGSYQIKVTGNDGCIATKSISITEPNKINLAFNSNNVNCYNGTDGSITVIPSSGVVPYNFLWSTSSTNQFIDNQSSGWYSVTVTDNNDCQTIDSSFISQPTPLSIDLTATDETCYNQGNGTVLASASGSILPYTYLWNTGSTLPGMGSLFSGTYQVTATDQNGCTISDNIQVNSPDSFAFIEITTNTTCGDCDGVISVLVSGGTGPSTTLVWSTMENGNSISQLCAGIYGLTVTDQIGCQESKTYTIINTDGPIVDLENDTLSCYLDIDGSLTANVSGGLAPYTYIWNDPTTQSSQTANGLDAGNYQVVVTDDNDCPNIASAWVVQPGPLVFNYTSNDPNCLDSCNMNGILVITGGTSPYSYQWPVSASSQTTATATGLCSGTYLVTVTDFSGCQIIDSVVIDETPPISVSLLSTNINCFSFDDGLATALVSGGESPYNYFWSNGGVNATSVGLSPGMHYVTVTGNSGCSITDSVNIIEPSILQLDLNTTPISCNGFDDGMVEANPSGGTTPYGYSWAGGSNDTLISGLQEAMYYVTLTDFNGCVINDSAEIIEPAVLTASFSATEPLCNDSNGILTVNTIGGTGSYTYLWDATADSQTTASATNLEAGAYQVLVTDSNFCSALFSSFLSNSNGPNVSLIVQDETCINSSNGQASAIATGGTPPFSYLWFNSDTTFNTNGLAVGSVSVSVTDFAGCLVIKTDSVHTGNNLDGLIAYSNISCGDTDNGSATVSVNGGVFPYNYSWSNGAISATISNLTTGWYFVTVEDLNDCPYYDSVFIAQPTDIDLTLSKTNVVCNGYTTGNAIVTPNGGIAPYTYIWSNGSTDSTISNLMAGVYTVTVFGSSGCQSDTTLSITEPVAIDLAITPTSPDCDSANGNIKVVASNGNGAPYTYQWGANAGFQIGDSISSLSAGAYDVTVSDALLCISEHIVILSNNTGPSIDGVNITNVLCNSDTTGAIDLTVTGDQPIDYLWSNGSTSEDINNQPADNYSLTITDVNNCQTIFNDDITQPDSLQIVLSKTDETCDDCNGIVSSSILGGTGPFDYLWSDSLSSVTDSISNLCAGIYTLSITDNNGCTLNAQKTVNNIASITGETIDIDNVICFGDSTGAATISPIGGVLPITATWSNGATGLSISGLPAATYFVTMTDASLCERVITVTIDQPAPIVALFDQVQPLCDSANGSITANISGGNSVNYAYQWGVASGFQTTQTANNLLAGTYSIVVLDTLGCSAGFSSVLNNLNAPEVSSSTTDKLCFSNNNGAIDLSITGSTPFNFLWSNGATTEDINGLSQGIYTVTITDSLACVLIYSDTINSPSEIELSFNNSDATCGNCDGISIVAANGGAGGFSYQWDAAAGNSISPIASPLCPNAYSVTITDANGCKQDSTITINNDGGPTGELVTINNASCFGIADGSASIIPQGGVPPYSYTWPGGQTAATVNFLEAGNYNVTVADDNDCERIVSITIDQPDEILGNFTTTNPSCGNNDGSLMINATGGTGSISSFTYQWDVAAGSGMTALAGTLFPGAYTVTVTDSIGCFEPFTGVLSNDNGPTIDSVQIIDVTCYGDTNGSIQIFASGIDPLSYLWSTGGVTSSINNLFASDYTVSITDSNSCITVSIETVNSPDSLTIDFIKEDETCGGVDGSAIAVVTGGTQPYTYTWDASLGFSTDSFAENLSAASYFINVDDANFCSSSGEVIIANIGGPTGELININNVSCNNECNGAVTITPIGGISPYTFLWPDGQTTGTRNDLCAGNYDVSVSDNNQCTRIVSLTITEPDAIATTSSKILPTCGLADGSITMIPSGGSGNTNNWDYQWDANAASQNTITANGLSAGSYFATITDSLSCSNVFLFALSNINGPTLDSVQRNDLNCYGDSNGSLIVYASGLSPFAYLWTTGDISQGISNLPEGMYGVSIIDTNGCITAHADTILSPDSLIININAVDATCGSCNGTLAAIPSGGTGNYIYQWDAGLSNQAFIDSLCPGTYSITVEDENGCQANNSRVINNVGGPDNETIDINHVSCFNLCDGMVSITPSGGQQPYKIIWQDGDTTAVKNGLCAGTYNVTIMDANMCARIIDVTVQEPNQITVSYTKTLPQCQQNDGTLTALASGGNGTPFTYQWGPATGNQIGASATLLFAGTYQLTVTDSLGCTNGFSEPLNNIGGPTIDSIRTQNILCFGGSTGEVEVYATGLAPLTYLWSDGNTNALHTNVGAGIYTISVSDSLLCISTASDTVTQAEKLITNLSALDATCGDCNGQVISLASGGTGGYDYLWSANALSATTSSVSNLCADVYLLTLTDGNSCSVIDSIVVNDVGGPSAINASVQQVSCNGVCSGQIILVPVNGTAPYQINWSSGQTSFTLSNLCAGSYSATITDASLCSIDTTIVIDQPEALSIAFSAINATCGLADGQITAQVTGGIGNYSYTWGGGATGQTDSVATGLDIGVYPVTVTDSLSCTLSDSTVMSNINGPVVTIDSLIEPSCYGFNDGAIDISANSVDTPLTYLWSTGAATEDINGLISAVYIITVSDTNNCATLNLINLAQPDSMFVSISQSKFIACYGICNAELIASTSGGISPYTFLWDDASAQTDSVATALCDGLYNLTVTDLRSCIKTASFTVNQPDTIVANITSINNPLCTNSGDGSIAINAAGGSGTFGYNWVGPNGYSNTTQNINTLNPGAYNLTISDSLGCTIQLDTNLIAQIEIIIDSITASDYVICESEDSVALKAYVSGAATPSFQWSIGFDNLGNSDGLTVYPEMGNNTYIFTASQGACISSDTIEIEVEASPEAEAGSVQPFIVGICKTIGGNPTGPSGSTFEWSPSDDLSDNDVANPSACPIVTTEYVVTVTSANGCISKDSITLTVLPNVAFIPGFSPNGDGKRDVWIIDNLDDFPDVLVQVFNRWGQKLYESNPGYTNPWDGTYKGKALPVGTYYFVINLNHPDFPDPLTGPVSILK